MQVSTTDHQSFLCRAEAFLQLSPYNRSARICSHFLKECLGGKKSRQHILHFKNWAHLIIKTKDIFMLKEVFCEITQLRNPRAPP